MSIRCQRNQAKRDFPPPGMLVLVLKTSEKSCIQLTMATELVILKVIADLNDGLSIKTYE